MQLLLIRIPSCHNEYFNIPSLTDNAVDGESFLDLSESDLKEMIPNKMGVVKRILKLQQEVSYRQARKHNHIWQQSVSNYCIKMLQIALFSKVIVKVYSPFLLYK